MSSTLKREYTEELERLYADLDAAIESHGWQCRACGDCCRFAQFGHMLYCSEAEAEHLIGDDEPRSEIDEAVCPFLTDSACARRNARTIGCRVYHCQGCTTEEMSALSEEYVKRLKDLHIRFGLPWRYAWLGAHVTQRKGWPCKE